MGLRASKPEYCKYCGKEIFFHKDRSKWTVYNLDLSIHTCDRSKGVVKVLTRKDLDPELIKQYESNMNK